MNRARTAHLFLMDGSPNGRIKCSLDNWVGKAYLIPRTDISRSIDREELKQAGIYLLFGTEITTGNQTLYIGQAGSPGESNGVLGRVTEYRSLEESGYFTHAIFIIDSEDSLGPTETIYIANALHEQAKTANRTPVIKADLLLPKAVSEEKAAALDEFIEASKLLIGSLGYRIFDAADEAKPIRQPSTQFPAPPTSVEPELCLSVEGSSAEGTGRQTAEGFVVFAGARLNPKMYDSASRLDYWNRRQYRDRIDENFELLEDTPFTSPSAAAQFLTGYASNGRILWKTLDGTTLKDLEKMDLNRKA